MILPDTPEGWVQHLGRLHDADIKELNLFNQLYEGTAPLAYLHPDVLQEVGDRITAVALGWPMMAVDPLEERLDLLGFRYPEDDEGPAVDAAELAAYAGDANLQRVWQDNDLDEESQLGHVDALVMRRAYAAVGANEADADTPLVTVESPLEVYAEIDPRDRRVRAAVRRWREWTDPFNRGTQDEYATLYLPDATVWLDRGPTGWREIGRDNHRLGEVPIVPLTNRARLSDRYGRSELTPPMLSLSHAANKIATDMMVAGEFHAIPLRAIFGIGPDDLKDEAGNRVSAMKVILGRLLTIEGDGDGNAVKPHEFTASSLNNFHDTLSKLAQLAAGLLGLDPHMFGFTTDNPASAEALKAREARLITRAQRKQRAFGGAWEQAMRLVRRIQEGDWDPAARRLEAIWRDAATPTRAQAADAATKLLSTPEPIISVRQAREDLGYTPAQIRRMESEDEVRRRRDAEAAEQAARAAAAAAPETTARPRAGTAQPAGAMPA